MKTLALILLSFLACRAEASIVTADFSTAAHLPYCCGSPDNGPVERKALMRTVDESVELGPELAATNPSGWFGGSVDIDLDPLAKTVTLSYADINDFETFTALISNIRFDTAEFITGFTLVSNTLFETMVPYEQLTPTLLFTRNSLRISVDERDGFYLVDGTAVFAYTTAPVQDLPEPATLGLLAAGMAGLLARRRRR